MEGRTSLRQNDLIFIVRVNRHIYGTIKSLYYSGLANNISSIKGSNNFKKVNFLLTL